MKPLWFNNPAKRRDAIEFSVGVIGGAIMLALLVFLMVAL